MRLCFKASTTLGLDNVDPEFLVCIKLLCFNNIAPEQIVWLHYPWPKVNDPSTYVAVITSEGVENELKKLISKVQRIQSPQPSSYVSLLASKEPEILWKQFIRLIVTERHLPSSCGFDGILATCS